MYFFLCPLPPPHPLAGPNPTHALDGALYLAHQKLTGAYLGQEGSEVLSGGWVGKQKNKSPPGPGQWARAGNLGGPVMNAIPDIKGYLKCEQGLPAALVCFPQF